jgi:hypothetical protein
MHQIGFMICKAYGFLKEGTKAFSIDIQKLKKLEHAKNGELKSYSKNFLESN